jgi:hypothetical protein
VKALADLLTQAAEQARAEGHTWLVSRIGADLMRLDTIERSKQTVERLLPSVSIVRDLRDLHVPGAQS